MSKPIPSPADQPSSPALARRLEPEDISPAAWDSLRDMLAPSSAPASSEPVARAQGSDKSLIQSVNRALDILEMLAERPQALRLQEIAAGCGLNGSTCHHLLNTLVYRGYVSRQEQQRTYRLGAQLLELMKGGNGAFDLVSEALPEIRRLSLALDETVILAAFSGSSLVILTRQDPPDGRRGLPEAADVTAAAHATAVGKAMLAWLPEPQIARVVADRGLTPFTAKTIISLANLVESLRQIRRHGFAVEDEEFAPGLSGIACALRGHAGEVLGAIGCLLPTERADNERLSQAQQALSTAAAALSQRFGRHGLGTAEGLSARGDI